MKKFYFIWLLTILVIGSQFVMADVVTTSRKIQKPSEPVTQEQLQRRSPRGVSKDQTPSVKKETKLSNSVKSCKRYYETLDTTISGVDFNFQIDILGWYNNKCRVDFRAKSTGISENFTSLHGMDPSMATITTFEPKVRCEFTKEQLKRVGDSILQEEERSESGAAKMLKNPALINIKSISELSGSDAALMDVILREGACVILNAPNSQEMFDSLLNY
jgi:hypothetical protein